nr:immunoglobulin heavy chain junction region [Macaca mulatta]MOX91543.1 immunoglobulin heavy chain junction region [Macaca mulatta]MOX91641.1 immunoglobulin heavy chain junction region [Macaca mulatta]MOX91659.1 immunoglobulin heavy chain junction region [Macaca mulatta]MOX91895.1 immunoglobulin heavy chain junction region [Macaca mulatta]
CVRDVFGSGLDYW